MFTPETQLFHELAGMQKIQAISPADANGGLGIWISRRSQHCHTLHLIGPQGCVQAFPMHKECDIRSNPAHEQNAWRGINVFTKLQQSR